MDANTINQLIGSLGFPIFMCIYIEYKNNKLNEQWRESVAKLTEIINNNTLALTKLSDEIKNIKNFDD